MIRFIDLFAGIGGTRLAFEQACSDIGVNASCVLSSEIDQRARETYQTNFGEMPQGDIRGITSFPRFNFLLAGFPCQPFSYAGKHEGFGDTRGTLFFQIERVLKNEQPIAFLLENVRGLITHDRGRTFKTILHSLKGLNYNVKYLLLNSSNFDIPQNRVRVYILGALKITPKLTLMSDVGAADSHKFKQRHKQTLLLDGLIHRKLVKDILEENPDKKYNCSGKFVNLLSRFVGSDFKLLNGLRLIDYRHGHSIHSWELGIKGECSREEIEFMNSLVANRRKKVFGIHQDGKKLTLDQIRTFYDKPNLEDIVASLIKKGYLKVESGKYNPVCGNMSFEVFKFLDPDSISITLTSSDAHKLGVVQNNTPRHITPRECARLQGFPDTFKCHPDDKFAYKQFGNAVTVPVVKEVLKDFLSNNLQALRWWDSITVKYPQLSDQSKHIFLPS
jgi:DNA (cytosine-5)-methyltransferase 1